MDREKTTWTKIFQDFKQRHPTLTKQVSKWQPHSYATIEVKLVDGMSMIYNYDEHRAMIING